MVFFAKLYPKRIKHFCVTSNFVKWNSVNINLYVKKIFPKQYILFEG